MSTILTCLYNPFDGLLHYLYYSQMEAMKVDDSNMNVDHNSGMESEKSLQHNVTVQVDNAQNEKEEEKAHVEIATSDTKIPDAESALPQEVNLS